jgi:acyl-coenzyme A synthetase/AMP-(fatty) acid ligase
MKKLPLMTRCLDQAIAWRDGQTISAGQFINQAQVLAERLSGHGPVINLCQDRHVFSLAFAAAIVASRTTLLPANRLTATISRLLDRYPDSLVISEHPIDGLDHACMDPGPIRCDSDSVKRMPQIEADLLAAMVFTSGSTGPSSSVRKPWLTLYHSSRINAAEYGPDCQTHVLATVPPQHMWGLETSVLLPWFSPVIMACGQPFFAADIVEQLERLPRPRALVSTPVHLRNLSESGLDPAALDRIYSATAPLGSDLAQRLATATSAEVTEVFGCSEAGCLARRDPVIDAPWQLFTEFSLSHQGQRVRVNAAHLPEPVELLDHLKMERDGRFRLAGRHSDLVNIAGKRASLAELTQTLLDINGVVDGVIFQPQEASGGQVTRLAGLVVAPLMSIGEIRQALAERIDPAFMPRPLRLVPALPRAESGKLPRQSLDHFYRQVCEPAG